ncbi:cell wall surface anchor protein [Enterococcus florum]|uniref:Cell wall surface anchor protein n=1 Tax=Enterococcus florum TaxID=2480627 RepID=A0A4P5PGG5_9ENTE|nr:SpaH/EbpB family LPXTG-anchored major pilin [Enterococcus florum]GCF94742.1 cell wall surface anchor protein [Enterococcus florum]
MKGLRRLLLFFLVVSPFFFTSAQALAEESVEFTLHKIVFPANQMPEETQNTGEERLQQYQGLNNVTFEVYDVTADFYQALDVAGSAISIEEVQKRLIGMDVSGRTRSSQATTATIDGEEGIARFALPAKSQNRDAVYLFRETAAPADIKSMTNDLIVVLPLVNDSGVPINQPIHLYPKNERNQPPFEKEIVNESDSYQLGDRITYQLTTTLPSGLNAYSKFILSDQADSALLLDASSIKVEVNKKVFSSYHSTAGAHHFQLNFNLIDLIPLSGQELKVTYTMTLQSEEKVDQALINTAQLETDFDRIIRKRQIKTGGKRFVKVDMNDSERKLSGAAFLVKNNQGQYLQKKEGAYQWVASNTEAQLVKLTSDGEGAFEIKGLRYGTYALEEITAPEGYLLSQLPIDFVVAENSHRMLDGTLQIVNRRSTTISRNRLPGTLGSLSTVEGGKDSVSSVRRLLPQTNEFFARSMSVVGLIIVAGIVLYKVVGISKRKGE